MIALNDLSELQEIDLRLDAVKQERDGKLQQARDDPHVAALQTEESTQRQILDEVRGYRQSLEQSTGDVRTKIQTEDAKLYGGQIKDPKELNNLQAEIFGLRRSLKAQEDQLLSLIEQEEEAQAAATHVGKLVEASHASWQQQQQRLSAEVTALEEQIAVVEEEVNETRVEIEVAELDIYDAQRRLMPIVIARVVGGVCNGCHLTLPINAVNRARRADQPVRCPSCQRILYVA